MTCSCLESHWRDWDWSWQMGSAQTTEVDRELQAGGCWGRVEGIKGKDQGVAQQEVRRLDAREGA